MSHSGLSLQAEMPTLVHLPRVFNQLLASCPAFKRAALKGNPVPSLIRVMHELSPGRQATAEDPLEVNAAIDYCHSCLHQLGADLRVKDDADGLKAFWISVIDAGIVPVIADFLASAQEPVVMSFLRLSNMLVVAAPRGGGAEWPTQLLRAVAGVMSARMLVAPAAAAELLMNVGMMRRDLLADFHTWGVTESARRLTRRSDPNTASAAKALLFIVNQRADVSRSQLPRLHPLFILVLIRKAAH
jgi:hypothetical protein